MYDRWEFFPQGGEGGGAVLSTSISHLLLLSALYSREMAMAILGGGKGSSFGLSIYLSTYPRL